MVEKYHQRFEIPHLDQISQNGAVLIEKEYKYDALKARYESIIA